MNKPLNKNSQHRRSVETLELSGIDDEAMLQRITKLINNHTPCQPYSRNTLLRIKDLIKDVHRDQQS
jgi:hypothetical protein